MAKTKEEWSRRLKTEEEKQFMVRLLDKVNIFLKNFQQQATDFIDPHLQETAGLILEDYPGLNWHREGGAPGAERARIVLGGEEAAAENPVTIFSLEGSFKGKKPGHRDYLGALLGAGIKREKIGDLWVLPTGCAVAAAREIAPYLEQQPIEVWGTALEVNTLNEFQAVLPQGKTAFATTASLRFDAIAAAGYGASRSQIAREILAGKIKVNWQEITKPDCLLKEGDVLSARGRGRVKLASVAGESKKGRLKVILERMQ